MSTRRHRALLTALLSLAALHSARGAAEERAAAGVTAEPKSGQVEVTLAGVRTGVSGKDLRTTATGREPRWTRIDLRLMVDGAPSRLWLPQQVRIHGANGRSWVPTRVVSHFGRNGEGCIAFPDPQPRAESGWRFQLELARSSRYLPYEFWDVFRPSELWTVPLVEVPKPRKAEVANAHASTVMREGVRLKLVRMAGSRVPVPAGLAAKPRVPSLQVRYSPPLPGVNVTLLRATDFS
ncbi:MAG: hypothetical protein K0Q72_952, partial [Armatimonadetes bacterium]|nr:hypothetical protein [Armatimonadota bacterium]